MNLRVLAVIFFAGWQASALAVQDFTVTREELTQMPPYCTAFYGKYVGLPKLMDSPLRNTVPADCPALHHYCDGLKAMLRVDRDRAERGYWLQLAIGSFKERTSGWAERAPTCPIRAEAHTNLGKALIRQNKAYSGEAITNFTKALGLRPDYAPAYTALIDAYLELGKKADALETATQGLKYLPDSKNLLRRFKELGGKTPPPPIVAQKPAETGTMAGSQPSTPEQGTKPGASSASPTPASAASSGTSPVGPGDAPQEPVAPAETKIGTPTNPYCRFCPP